MLNHIINTAQSCVPAYKYEYYSKVRCFNCAHMVVAIHETLSMQWSALRCLAPPHKLPI